MNVLMLDPQRVMVEKKEVALQKVWECVRHLLLGLFSLFKLTNYCILY